MSKKNCYSIIKDLFPINRSLTGKGNLKTLNYIKKIIPQLKIKNFRSGQKFYDWTIPKEWNVKEAYIKNLKGEKIIDFKKNNLHLVGYSRPIKKILSKEKLFKNLHTLKSNKNAIPYITSYYKNYWGFCLSEKQKREFKDKKYFVNIETEHKKGKMHYGELIVKGRSSKEILLSTYICHPSMANNELSGIAVATKLAEWICQKKRKYSYRFIFVPETIGTIAYIKKNIKVLKKDVIAGYVITCVGDKGKFSFMPSREGNTLSDRVVKYVFKKLKIKFKEYSFNERGSQERQFCSPLVNLPIASVMKSKYGTFKEYHTSLDNLSFVSKESLNQSLKIYKDLLNFIEIRKIYKSSNFCEPMLSKKKIYPTLSLGNASKSIKDLRNIIAYADGKNFDFELAKLSKIKMKQSDKIIKFLIKSNLIKEI